MQQLNLYSGVPGGRGAYGYGAPPFPELSWPDLCIGARNSQRLRCLLARAPKQVTQLLRAPCSRGIEAGNPSEGNVQGPHLHSSHKLSMMQTVELWLGPLSYTRAFPAVVICRSPEACLGKDSWKGQCLLERRRGVQDDSLPNSPGSPTRGPKGQQDPLDTGYDPRGACRLDLVMGFPGLDHNLPLHLHLAPEQKEPSQISPLSACNLLQRLPAQSQSLTRNLSLGSNTIAHGLYALGPSLRPLLRKRAGLEALRLPEARPFAREA